MPRILYLAFLLMLISGFISGLIIPYFNLKEGDFVDPEYFSGILGGSSILFGLWVIALEYTEKKEFDIDFANMFFICLIFLVESVLAIALTAVNLFSPSLALLIITGNFCLNATMLGLSLYIKFRIFDR